MSSVEEQVRELRERLDNMDKNLEFSFYEIGKDVDSVRSWLWVIGGIIGAAIAMIVVRFLSRFLDAYW